MNKIVVISMFMLTMLLLSYCAVPVANNVVKDVLSLRTPTMTAQPLYSKIGFAVHTVCGTIHVVIFDYLSKTYLFYDYLYPDQAITGSPLILYNDTLYVEEEMPNSPLLVVINPTNGEDDWVFTLVTWKGVYSYYLQRIETNVMIVSDYIVLLEDTFNPYYFCVWGPGWADEVIRITIFSNNTVRISVYMAGGVYSHDLYVIVSKIYPLDGVLAYNKPFWEYWYYYLDGYYREIPGLTYYLSMIDVFTVFVKSPDDAVWYGLITEEWSIDWRRLGGIVADSPSTVFYDGKVYVFVRSPDGALWFGTLGPRDWSFSGWRPLPGLASSKLSAVVTDYGIALAVRDISNGIWIGLLDENSVSWISLPGSTVDSPSIAYLNNEIHIVARGLDGYTIWHGVVELPSFNFEGWRQIYGFTNSVPKLLVIENTLYLAVRDLGNGVALASFNENTGWLGWVFIPGGLTDASPSLSYFNGKLVVGVKALNDQSIWLSIKDYSGYWYWVNIPGLTTHEPELLYVKYVYISYP